MEGQSLSPESAGVVFAAGEDGVSLVVEGTAEDLVTVALKHLWMNHTPTQDRLCKHSNTSTTTKPNDLARVKILLPTLQSRENLTPIMHWKGFIRSTHLRNHSKAQGKPPLAGNVCVPACSLRWWCPRVWPCGRC